MIKFILNIIRSIIKILPKIFIKLLYCFFCIIRHFYLLITDG
ncbi:hypothetical protein [Moraxella lacunata]